MVLSANLWADFLLTKHSSWKIIVNLKCVLVETQFQKENTAIALLESTENMWKVVSEQNDAYEQPKWISPNAANSEIQRISDVLVQYHVGAWIRMHIYVCYGH